MSDDFADDFVDDFVADDGTVRDGIDENREDQFSLQTGRFRDDETGMFEDGNPPPDYNPEANRFRAEDGEFKDRSADLFDEPAEVRKESLEPPG